MKNNVQVGLIMGSDSDLEVFAEAAKTLDEFGVSYDMTVGSAHRSPERAMEFARTARERGMRVIIAGAGGAAHLAGVIAAHTTLPVVGLPTKAKSLDGLDSLLSTVQMPPGIPVGTVGIGSGRNAGILAVQILGTSDTALEEKLNAFKKKMNDEVVAKGEKLSEIGYKKYLEK